jgi:nucleoside diphosphate kinase
MLPKAFILCKPDLFLRGLIPQFLTFVEAKGFTVQEFYCGKVNPKHFQLMYSTTFRYDVDDWQHNQRLYEFGPALGLLLNRSDDEPALTSLKHLKGAALPNERAANSLRYLLGSKSRVFNLLHVPDREEECYEQALHWFGVDKWVDGSCSIHKEEIFRSIDASGYLTLNSFDPEYIFLKAKIRLMHSFQKRTFVSSSFQSQIRELSNFYCSWAEEVATSPLFNGIEGTILIARYEEERQRLQTIKNASNLTAPLLNAIQLLLTLSEKREFATNFFWILDEWNVFVSSIEHYLITCRLKYM